jgi:hypothetical protein
MMIRIKAPIEMYINSLLGGLGEQLVCHTT